MRPSLKIAGSLSRPMLVAMGCKLVPSAFMTHKAVHG